MNQPNFERLRKVLLRKGEPDKVPFYKLFADIEIMEAVTGEPMTKYTLENTAEGWEKYYKAMIKFYVDLGYDYVPAPCPLGFQRSNILSAADTANLPHAARGWQDEHHGEIEDRKSYDKYLWPDASKADFRWVEFLAKNVPDGMKLLFNGPGGVLENVMWLTGYEIFSYMLFEQPDLVRDISDKVGATICAVFERAAKLPNVGGLVIGDDMGFKTSIMVSPKAMREYIFPWQKKAAEVAHKYNLPFIIHSCGNLEEIMDDLIDYVKIDAKHSWEDVILPVTEAKKKYGKRIAILGGVDVDFLCRHTEDEVKKYTRNILEKCAPGGGYALGTGNTVANYIPVKNYLAMLEAGRDFSNQ